MNEHLGYKLRRARKLAGLTQEGLSERSDVSVDVIRQLEQRRKGSARLPTLHALSKGLGVELTSLLGDPPGVPSNGEGDPPQMVALRRAIMPPLYAPAPEPSGVETLTVELLRAEIADAWTLYHEAEFGRLMEILPGVIADARQTASVGTDEERAGGQAALGKALQLGGHLSIRMGKTDLALSSLERAIAAADASSDPLLGPMIANSVAWAYQRQNRLDDAIAVALYAADRVKSTRFDDAEGVKVWGGLTMSAATSYARSRDYEHADTMMRAAEKEAVRVGKMPTSEDNRMVSVFSKSSVRIERVRLAVQFGHPEEALKLAKGMRLSKDTPPSWRTWLLLDVARAHTDVGNAEGAVKALESLRRFAPTWMRHHTLAVSIVEELWELPNRPTGLRPIAEFLGVAA
ncbi:helix-turn-helix domain-containing protein [Streptomyces scopuliridis]|uniref:Helix-turn-helix domain-containing protein n=1 Tax=Streptomyces scopuliridis TaxID=452529 RepID=A0ACD4ZEI4_9ACTN|nr:helix-turn-helix transcriptional regulator [Streptomyces scopuliridis]WSB32637.1 helix-turn-helix domain-containing protein [Streptomyces scopuliridis]WSB96887.1 helix-turn-helix domain-containing protein [Streptomyces scopuliridis]WSC09409.1 helix-turn-helix domain-containing protein [Streptomyces scopuliridis]